MISLTFPELQIIAMKFFPESEILCGFIRLNDNLFLKTKFIIEKKTTEYYVVSNKEYTPTKNESVLITELLKSILIAENLKRYKGVLQ